MNDIVRHQLTIKIAHWTNDVATIHSSNRLVWRLTHLYALKIISLAHLNGAPRCRPIHSHRWWQCKRRKIISAMPLSQRTQSCPRQPLSRPSNLLVMPCNIPLQYSIRPARNDCNALLLNMASKSAAGLPNPKSPLARLRYITK